MTDGIILAFSPEGDFADSDKDALSATDVPVEYHSALEQFLESAENALDNDQIPSFVFFPHEEIGKLVELLGMIMSLEEFGTGSALILSGVSLPNAEQVEDFFSDAVTVVDILDEGQRKEIITSFLSDLTGQDLSITEEEAPVEEAEEVPTETGSTPEPDAQDVDELEALKEEAEAEDFDAKKYLEERIVEDHWRSAFSVAKRVLIPFNFSSRIRAVSLARKRINNNERLNQMAIELMYPFLIELSPSHKAKFYYAAKELYPIRTKDANPKTCRERLAIFSYDEITAIIAISIIYGQTKKKTDPELWDILEKRMRKQLEVMWAVSKSLPDLPSGEGMILIALRYLSLALISKIDVQKAIGYIKNLEKGEMSFDLEAERKVFGLTHIEVASILGVNLGYGTKIAEIFERYQSQDISDNPAEKIFPLSMMLLDWVNGGDGLKLPFPPTEYNGTEDSWNKLRESCRTTLASEPSFTWLQKTKSDYLADTMD